MLPGRLQERNPPCGPPPDGHIQSRFDVGCRLPTRPRLISTHSGDQARRRELSAARRQRQPHTIGTWLLLVVNTAIYVAMATDAGGIRSFSSRLLIAWGALFAPEVSNGEWWRLFTATFLHLNPLHLAFNMRSSTRSAGFLPNRNGLWRTCASTCRFVKRTGDSVPPRSAAPTTSHRSSWTTPTARRTR